MLIANSVEASDSGSAVEIRARRETRDPDDPEGITVEVEDHGAGMTAETVSKLFTPYFTTKKSAIGLGLCLAQKIVFGHLGTIEVHSEPGAGCRMKIWLPLFDPPENAAEEIQDGPDPDPR